MVVNKRIKKFHKLLAILVQASTHRKTNCLIKNTKDNTFFIQQLLKKNLILNYTQNEIYLQVYLRYVANEPLLKNVEFKRFNLHRFSKTNFLLKKDLNRIMYVPHLRKYSFYLFLVDNTFYTLPELIAKNKTGILLCAF